MGRGWTNWLLCLCIIPGLADGRVFDLELDKTHASISGEDSSLSHKQLDAYSNPGRTQIGLTLTPQPLSSPCIPEKVLDFTSLFESQENIGIFGNANAGNNEEYLGVSKYYLCTQICNNDGCGWRHHGISITLHINGAHLRTTSMQSSAGILNSRQESDNTQKWVGLISRNRNRITRSFNTLNDFAATTNVNPAVEITGISFEYESDKKRVEYDSSGSPRLLENMTVQMRLYGRFYNDTQFKLTKFQSCDDPHNHEKPVLINVDASGTMGTVEVTMPQQGELDEVFLCLKTPEMNHFATFGELGPDGVSLKPWLVIKLYKAMMPLWIHVCLLIFLLSLSGLFSGLNLGLMSLNKTDLKIIINTGSATERHHASAIAPVRNHGNFLLCCLLFSNVLVNASLTILVDDLTSGLIAIMMSTLAIVVFGEIIPQAICSRHGLAVGAKTIYITKFFMFITSPLALPLSKVLDRILGEEIGSVYNREKLKELLKVTQAYHGLETEEVGIISGALDMKSKTVKNVMVRLENAFMLPIDSVLDFDTMSDVEYHGYSRIPVYNKDRNNIVGLLNIKQLTLLDANDKIPLKTVVEYYQNKLFFVFENARLDFMLKAFSQGRHGHMAFVQTINDEGPGDPYYETIGLMTLEDVLEQLINSQIMDEADIGKYEARLSNAIRPKISEPFIKNRRQRKAQIELPAPLALATVQFLSTSVEPFSKTILSLSILKRLVANCSHHIKLPKHRGSIPDIVLYEAGKPTEYFIMVLEGRVEVTVGKEKLTYESGAFTTFGTDFLIATLASESTSVTAPTPVVEKPDDKPKKRTFIPDYSVKVVTDLHYLMLKYSAYRAAILATGIERTNADPTQAHSKNWQEEIDKMLEKLSGYDDDTTSETSRRPKLSRDESFRGTNIILPGESEAINRKISCLTIEESGLENHHEGLEITNGKKMSDITYTNLPTAEEKIPDDKGDGGGEKAKLLE